jgi:hypothetical protein
MNLPSATASQLCLRGPADGQTFEADDLDGEEIALIPPPQFVAAVHHGSLCCGDGYDEATGHDDDDCDCLPPSRGLYTLDLDRSVADGARWIYVYEREVLAW